MTLPIPLQAQVICPPKVDRHCRAERLHSALTHVSYQLPVPAIGIPLFRRRAGAVPSGATGGPRSIQTPGVLNDLSMALVRNKLADKPGGNQYLTGYNVETKAKSPHTAPMRGASSASVAGGADRLAAHDLASLPFAQGAARENADHRRGLGQ